MAFSEKDTTPAYSPIHDDQSSNSARESDELLHDGYPTARPRVASRKRRALIAVGGVAIFLAYSFALTSATSMWWKKQRVHGANVIESKPETPEDDSKLANHRLFQLQSESISSTSPHTSR